MRPFRRFSCGWKYASVVCENHYVTSEGGLLFFFPFIFVVVSVSVGIWFGYAKYCTQCISSYKIIVCYDLSVTKARGTEGKEGYKRYPVSAPRRDTRGRGRGEGDGEGKGGKGKFLIVSSHQNQRRHKAFSKIYRILEPRLVMQDTLCFLPKARLAAFLDVCTPY